MKDILNNFRSRLNEMMIDDAIDLIIENNRIHNPATGQFRKGKAQKVPIKKSCSDYPADYLEEADGLIDEDEERVDQEYWRATIKNAIRDEIQKAMRSNTCSLSDITRALDAFSRSSKGKLVQEPKGD